MEEELLSRKPPQSLEAEQSVLGSILIDSRCITDVVGVVTPEDFYLQQNREIFETIYTMFNFSQTIDPVTVLDKLKELGYYHDNSRDYILQLMEYCGSITTNGHPPRIISLTTNGFPVIPDYMRQEQTSMQELQLQRWNVSNRQESVLMINPT